MEHPPQKKTSKNNLSYKQKQALKITEKSKYNYKRSGQGIAVVILDKTYNRTKIVKST